jgi:hypothetical protein
MTAEDLAELAILLDCADDLFDDAVHDMAQEAALGELNSLEDEDAQDEHITETERRASSINNGGFEEQIEFLLESGYSAKELEQMIRAGRRLTDAAVNDEKMD